MKYALHYSKWIVLGIVTLTAWNVFLAKRDSELFRAYDQQCAKIQYSDPNCKYAK